MSNNKVLKPPVMMKLKRKRIGNTKRIQNDPYNQIPKQKKPYCHGDEVFTFFLNTFLSTFVWFIRCILTFDLQVQDIN